MATLIFLIGVRGAGKTSVLERLRQRPDVIVLQPTTTRDPRPGEEHEYHHVDQWKEAEHVWSIRVGENTYGMRRSEIAKLTDGKVCVTVFDAGHVGILEQFRQGCQAEAITVGLDTIKDQVGQRDRVGGVPLRMPSLEEFNQQRECVANSDIVFRGDFETVAAAVGALIDLVQSRGGLLTKRTTEAFIAAGSLLRDAEVNRVEPASYDLRVGDEIWCQGRFITLTAR